MHPSKADVAAGLRLAGYGPIDAEIEAEKVVEHFELAGLLTRE